MSEPCRCDGIIMCESHHAEARDRMNVSYSQLVEYARATCDVCDECGGCVTHKTCTENRRGMFSSPKGHPPTCILGLTQCIGPWPS